MARTPRLLLMLAGALCAQVQAATHTVTVQNFEFVPAEITIAPGDTVVWEWDSGLHNVVADDGSFSSGVVSAAPMSFSQAFDNEGAFPYYCEPHGSPGGFGMAGIVTVDGSISSGIDFCVTGSWFNAETDGQGFSIEIIPSTNSLLVYWFTYESDGGKQQWLVGAGTIDGNRAEIEIVRPQGGKFVDPTAPSNTPWGSGVFEFLDPLNGTFSFTSDADGSSDSFPITRITAPVNCPGQGGAS